MSVTLSFDELADLLDEHRQEHEPETGASHCSCGEWRGPFTRHAEQGRRFSDHLAAMVKRWVVNGADQ